MYDLPVCVGRLLKDAMEIRTYQYDNLLLIKCMTYQYVLVDYSKMLWKYIPV